MADLETNDYDPEPTGHKRYRLEGRLSWPYKQKTIEARQFELLAIMNDGVLDSVALHIQFKPETLKWLSCMIPDLKHEGQDTFAFSLKPEFLKKYYAELYSAITIEDWFELGDSMCLIFDNYDCTGPYFMPNQAPEQEIAVS